MISYIIVFTLALIFLYFGVFKQKLGILFLTPFVILMHKQYFSLLEVWDLLPIRIALIFFIIGYLIYLFINKKYQDLCLSYKKNLFIILITFFTFSILLSFINTINIQESIQLFLFTFLQFIFIAILINEITSVNLFNKLITSYSVVISIASLFVYFQIWYFSQFQAPIGALWHIPNVYTRYGSLFWDVNHFGSYIVSGLFIILSYFLSVKKITNKLLMSLLLLVILPTIFLTNSRSAWLGMGGAGVIYMILVYVNGYKKLVVSMFLIGILAVIGFLGYLEFGTDFSISLWFKDYNHTRLDSSESHLILLNKSWQIFEKHQVVGGGYGNFNEQLRTLNAADNAYYFTRDPGAAQVRVPSHSIWGQVLSETGILGLTFYVLLIGSVLGFLLKISLSKKDILSSGFFASILSLLISGIFYSFNIEFYWWIIGFGILYSLINDEVNLTNIINWFEKNRWLLIIFIIGFASYYLFISLGSTALIDYDEAIYAKVARNIKESGDFLTLYWNTSKPWFEKPPLYMWLTSLTLGLSNYYYTAWAIRFWSALFGLLTIYTVFKWAKNQFGYFSAFISAISLVTTVHFLYYSRIGMLDVTVTFFITLALYFYYFGKGRVRNLLIAGALIGFGVMTKAIIGLLPLVIIGFYELALIFNKEKKISQSIKEFVTMFLGIFVIAGPWHLYMFFMHGTDFWNSYFVHQIFKRGTTGEQDKVAPFWWYVTVIKVSMRFWYIILIPSLAYFVLQFIQNFKKIKISKSYLFLIIWVLTVFSFFSFSQTKLIWYIIPLYPALSIMIGAFVSLVINKKISYLLLGILTWISVILLGISLIPSSLNLFQNLLLGLLLIVIGGLASLIVTFVYSNNIFHKRYFKYFALYIVLIIGFYNIYLVRDRVWTEDFNKFKLVLIHTANYKVLDIDKLYYVEMPDPAVGFYSFKDIKGAGSTDLYKIYSNLPFSEKMLILAESGSDKEFLDNKVDVTRLNKEDNYYLYQVQSKREKIQGEINKASDLLRYLMLEIQASIRSQGYATQEQLQDKLMFENTIEEKTKTLNILLEEEKLDLIKKEERNKLD